MNCKTEGCTRTGRIVKGLCTACYQRAAYAANPEAGRKRASEYRAANPEKQKAADAAWYAKNAEYKRTKGRARQAAETPEEREARLAYAREYNPKHYAANREARIQATIEWQRANPERANRKSSAWAKANPDARRVFKQTRRTRKTEAGGTFTKSEWLALCERFDNVCPSCGGAGLKLTADHIVPVSLGGHSNIDNIQPLCGPCNSRKGDSTVRFEPR